MAKLYFTELPTQEELRQNSALMYPDLDHLTLYSHILLRKITTDLEVNLDSFFSKYNLSAGRFTLMALLNKHTAGLMPSELAQKVGVTQATISGLINSLEKAGIVKRMSHEKDGRSFVIQLTPEGNAKVAEIMPLYHERISNYWSEFSEPEKTQLNSFMERIIKNIFKLGQA